VEEFCRGRSGIPAPAKRAIRERILSDEELKAVWLAADSDTATLSRIIQICILTGQRRGEMSKLRWEYIDQEKRLITLPSFITKNGRPHTFPYGPMLEAVLKKINNTGSKLFPGRTEKNEFFEGWSRGKENFDLLSPLKEQWQLHDLRRVFYSNMAALGVAPHVCAKLVNHVTGIAAISGISAVYNKHLYVTEMREAVRLWEGCLQSLCTDNQTLVAMQAA
jgi:integrase